MNTGASRRILLADCDAMFVAVARLEDPDGAGKAPFLIVSGRPEKRGVVCSASYETRAFGVRSGMPTSQALRLCPQAIVVPVPRAAVVRASQRICDILEGYAVIVAPASIDEFYLDLTGTEHVLGDELEEVAQRIREHVLTDVGISLSIGGGTNRLVAKLAATLAKPGGIRIVPPGEEAAFLRQFSLGDLPGIGPKSVQRLARYGLRTVEDALRHPLDVLIGWLGSREGHWLYDRIRGVDPAPVKAPGPPKSHGREETFPQDLYDDSALDHELLALAVRVSVDLARDGRLARTVTVKVRDSDFRTRQASRTLVTPVVSERQIFRVARSLLRRLRAERRTGVRLLGVSLSNLVRPVEWVQEKEAQLSLFETRPDIVAATKERDLAKALDQVRRRHGPDAILPAVLFDRDSSGDCSSIS